MKHKRIPGYLSPSPFIHVVRTKYDARRAYIKYICTLKTARVRIIRCVFKFCYFHPNVLCLSIQSNSNEDIKCSFPDLLFISAECGHGVCVLDGRNLGIRTTSDITIKLWVGIYVYKVQHCLYIICLCVCINKCKNTVPKSTLAYN